jgi:DNA-directed RNA polymerase subunit RPC12/RpoP
MTTPPEQVTIKCPECGGIYQDWIRRSVNLSLDDFDDEYLDQCSSAVCPACKHKVYFENLVVKDGVFYFSTLPEDEENDEWFLK